MMEKKLSLKWVKARKAHVQIMLCLSKRHYDTIDDTIGQARHDTIGQALQATHYRTGTTKKEFENRFLSFELPSQNYSFVR